MKILLAIDDSPQSDAAVKAVADHFRSTDTQVCVYHAVNWMADLPTSFMFGEGPTFDRDILSRKALSFRKAEELVGRVAKNLQATGFQTTTATPDSDPIHGIVEEAAHSNVDLIVMGSHGRRGLHRMLLGSVAESVMRHAPCSVEIVRLPPSPMK